PKAGWAYITLLRKLRSTKYDLAMDLSCSESGLAAFIVGFSGSRFRIGIRGRRDQWFNVRLERPRQNSKYKNLVAVIGSMGLQTQEQLPSLVLSVDEREEGKYQLELLLDKRKAEAPIVGVFVGGRKSWGKRWPEPKFLELINYLVMQPTRIIVFIGPEE